MSRTYADRCPGVLRPWMAADGAIVRLRLIGGEISSASLCGLIEVAEKFGDGTVLLTKRTNLQLRGINYADPAIRSGLVDAVGELGLLPAPSHELIRNVMVSPLSGRSGGLADVRSVAHDLDEQLCNDPVFAGLAGRFLFVLDDGRGDVAARPQDLGVFAISADSVKVRVGSHHWGPSVPIADAATSLISFARRFLTIHGTGGSALWHIDELPDQGRELLDEVGQPENFPASNPPAFGPLIQRDGRTCHHVAIPDGVLTRAVAEPMLGRAGAAVIVTPWRSVLLPDLEDL